MYYRLPLNCAEIIRSNSSARMKKHDKANVIGRNESIHLFLQLIIMTNFSEYMPEDAFGCRLWEYEFETSIDYKEVRHSVQAALLETITSFESRLYDVKVEVAFLGNQSFSRKVSIRIYGKLAETAEPFEHQQFLFICPKTVTNQ